MRAGMPIDARHRDVQRRVLVAVADLRAQHFARGRQADRRLLVEQRVDVPRQPLGALARRRSPATAVSASARISGASLSMNGSGFRYRIDVRIGRARLQRLRVDRARSTCRRTSGRRPGDPRWTDRRPRVRSRSRRTSRGSSIAPAHRGDDRSSLEQVGLHAARHASVCARSAGSRTVIKPERALLAHDLARVGDPRRRSQAVEFHLDAERRDADARRHFARLPGRRSSTITGAFRSVAGSKMVHCWREPATRRPPASSRESSERARAPRRARAFRFACCRPM